MMPSANPAPTCSIPASAAKIAIATGSVVSVLVEGTSATTKIYVYDDGTLVDKGDGTTWNFDTANDIPNGSTYANTGQYTGLGGYDDNVANSVWDNFAGGTW